VQWDTLEDKECPIHPRLAPCALLELLLELHNNQELPTLHLLGKQRSRQLQLPSLKVVRRMELQLSNPGTTPPNPLPKYPNMQLQHSKQVKRDRPCLVLIQLELPSTLLHRAISNPQEAKPTLNSTMPNSKTFSLVHTSSRHPLREQSSMDNRKEPPSLLANMSPMPPQLLAQ
jgi:hypothetical protein